MLRETREMHTNKSAMIDKRRRNVNAKEGRGGPARGAAARQ